MSAKTSIAWTDRTWNCVTGCTKVSEGCRHCYAETIAERFWAQQYPPVVIQGGITSALRDGVSSTRPRRFTDVQCHEGRLAEPLSWRKPQRVFVNSMSDLFHPDVPFDFIAAVFAVMAYCSTHTFQVLSKRPNRMREFMAWVNDAAGSDAGIPRMSRVRESLAEAFFRDTAEGVDLDVCLYNRDTWPPRNVWLGTSIEDQQTADERIPDLLATPAAVRFVSAEPILGGIDLRLNDEEPDPDGCYEDRRHGLHWVIVGGESGSKARPCDIGWICSVVQQCQAAKVPCFVKQLGANPIWRLSNGQQVNNGARPAESRRCAGMADRSGRDPSEWPEYLRVREFPEVRS